ncbi:MAG TPA: hypothetical protein VFV89_07850 [Nocardioides sp.]|uniref:hypothetical protein n=1 Tax=Nocardioides sp. TaxID=35761 RepID=UPI002E2F14CA|nr:hypothetical protein [Nocardioides sp.]HEX5087705.1 hypothetical protein [Nocardioides sp.]
MRADADLMVYVAARWPSLVREAVRLGVSPAEAPDVAAEALARCRRAWGRASREENVDALVREELVRAASRRAHTPEATREEAARELLVLAPPDLEDLEQRQRESDRAGLKRAGIVAVPLLLVATGAGAYVATSGDSGANPDRDDVLPNVAVVREENPAPGVVWYADGKLHLAHQVLSVDGVRDMTRIGDGVVYGDDEGLVVYAADDGSREVLGHKDPALPVVATDETGWAAWVDPTGKTPRLVVTEASTGNAVRSFPVGPGARAVAVDGNAVYYSDPHGTYVVPSPSGEVAPFGPWPLLDVRSRIRASQVAKDTIEVVQSIFNASFDAPGRGAVLAPDGVYVVTRDPVTGEVMLYDNRSGDRLPTGLDDGDEVVALSPGTRLTIAYVVRPFGASAEDGFELRTCDLARNQCVVRARILGAGPTPVLAR